MAPSSVRDVYKLSRMGVRPEFSLPRIFYAWFVYSATVATDRARHREPRGASTGAFRRGGQFSTRANLGHASNTKGSLELSLISPIALRPSG